MRWSQLSASPKFISTYFYLFLPQALAEWTKVFPLQVTETYTSSVTFIKQLTTVAVSTITYLKNAFPEENYTIDQFGGLKIRVLKNKCEDELAQFLITALTQAFEAFDKKYLHQIALCFYADSCALENLLECHVFEYEYGAAGAALRLRSSGAGPAPAAPGPAPAGLDEVRDRTLQLIRACMVMLSHTQLPETYDVSLRLYYNDAAPAGYQAPGFVPAGGADPSPGGAVRLGSVLTPYHRLTLRAYCRQPDDAPDSGADSREAIASQNPPIITQAPDDCHERAEEAGRIECPCRLRDEDPSTALLTCRFCGTRQHAACYGVLRAAGAGACYAVFRRALAWLHGRRQPASGRELAARLRLAPASARKLLAVLRSQRVLPADPPHDLDTPIEISTEHLMSVIKIYFRWSEEDDILERLVEESIASQEAVSQHDPIGDVLSPLEKVSLQHTSQLGRVIPAEVNNNVVDDETLQQYRAAMELADAAQRPPARRRRPGDAGVRTKRVKTARK
ncbi:uncharacterized protein LOC126366162 [Pectinophora gossypiella]|uniref:uncharacterized protein LOC126366162 n=1 Tax=Pectinophora gossypiella TaxID=13191 RepID=UPI00214E2F4D|nr:uncharacterized protein LOC126366162 [Pectinophora gossypiella]